MDRADPSAGPPAPTDQVTAAGAESGGPSRSESRAQDRAQSADPNDADTVEPGAEALLRQLLAVSLERPERISLHGLENHSRASGEEFEAMRSRLARLLETADGGALRVLLAPAEEDGPPTVELAGAAYLVTKRCEVERWELYLEVRQADGASQRLDGPVLLTRHAVPGRPQLTTPAAWRPVAAAEAPR